MCRIGAIHSVVFGGFSAESLKQLIVNAKSNFVITVDGGAARLGKRIAMKAAVDKVVAEIDFIRKILVVRNTGTDNISWNNSKDICYTQELKKVSNEHLPQAFADETPLFMLYTSGFTGAPKGLVHSSAGYLVYASMTHKLVSDYKDHDVY